MSIIQSKHNSNSEEATKNRAFNQKILNFFLRQGKSLNLPDLSSLQI